MTKVKVFDCFKDDLQSQLDEHYAAGYTLTSLVHTNDYNFIVVMTKTKPPVSFSTLRKETPTS